MKKNLQIRLFLITILTLMGIGLRSQEVTFPYDGTTNLTVNSSSTINQGIRINFNDLDVVNNFYTQNENPIYMYIALETDNNLITWEYPYGNINTTSTLIPVPLSGDTNIGAGPNSYSLVINPRQYFTSVPAGTTVYGYHILFRNQFGTSGNNQTVNLYVDLQDAIYSSTCTGGSGNYEDIDCDGVLNAIDLDNDNDGILDTNEGYTCSNNILQWTQVENDPSRSGFIFSYGSDPYVRESDDTRGTTIATANFYPAVSFTATKLEFDFSFDDFGHGLTTELWINGVKYMSIVIPNDQGPPLYWVEDSNSTTVYAPVTYYNGATGNLAQVEESKLDPPAETGVTIRNNMVINFPSPQTLTSGSIQIRNISQIPLSGGFPGSADYNYWIKMPHCYGSLNTDGDGIPDYLDLDSDNDGCSDAIEGGANITNSQLVNSGGTLQGGNGVNPAVTPTSGTYNQAVLLNLCNGNTCVDANGIPTVLSGGQSVGNSANSAINSCVCYEDANTTTAGVESKHGITLLKRAGNDGDSNTANDWPMIRKSAHTVLESNSKGFVVTRVSTAGLSAITAPQDGMMVYDTTTKCLKIYTVDEAVPANTGWKCYSTPSCP